MLYNIGMLYIEKKNKANRQEQEEKFMMTITKNIQEATAITHGGTFHADEVMATVILQKLFGKITICRTFRVPEDLKESVIVYDIGFGQFDHHQKGGNGARENGVPYAACGLIWKEFGQKIVADTFNPGLVWNLIDRDLIQSIDAVDNGVMPKADYPSQAMTLSSVISGFNPDWDSNEDPDDAFAKAVKFAEVVFDNTLKSAISKVKAQQIVEEAIEKAEEHIMVLDQFVPWQEYIFSSTNHKACEIQFVVFPSNRGGYNWQCVPDGLGSFRQRKSVPEEWKGLRDADIQKVTGIDTATFCHPAGFIGGAGTFADAFALAKMAVQA